MIPKIIHYCWFGRNVKPKLAKRCIKSWKRKCPDYQIIEWNEDNFDISSCPSYVKEAYEAKKWAFVTDYVRLKVIHDNGGIYLDTDVELKKNLDFLLSEKAYFGIESSLYIATGLGFGSEKGNPTIKELLEPYENMSFILDNGEFNLIPCPQINDITFRKYGYLHEDRNQILNDGSKVFASIYMCPINYETGIYTKDKRTISVHWFAASWHDEETRRKETLRERKEKKDYLIHAPNRFMMKLLGLENYEKLKKTIKHKS